jgi:predicted transcriptional regulator
MRTDIMESTRPPCLLVRARRNELFMSQRELSVRSGLPQPLICRVEAGREAMFSTYERLLDAMGMTLLCSSRERVPKEEIIAELVQMRLDAERRRFAASRERRRLRRMRRAAGGA